MSSTKKATQKIVEPKPKYALGKKVYHIFPFGLGGEEILECEITAIRTFQTRMPDELGNPGKMETFFKYEVKTGRGSFELPEAFLSPSFQEVAKEFSKHFLTLLK
jgi:hypothetical protein